MHEEATYKYDTVQFASPVAAAQLFTVEGSLVQGRPCRKEATWWDVQIWGYGSEQAVAPGTSGLAPDPGSLKSLQRSVPILGRIRYEGDTVDFDVGAGMRLAIYARNLNLSAVAPTGSVQINAPQQAGLINPAGAPAAINQQDSLVYGQIAEVDCPIGARLAKLTQTFSITGAGQFINIPARARGVQVFQDTAGGAPAIMNWRSNTISLIDLGQIDFQAGVQPFSTPLLHIPGLATIIDPGAAVRILTCVWELEL